MKVEIKDIGVAMEIKSKGMELSVRDTKGKHLGDLRVSKSKIEWCKGRTTAGKGKKMSWDKFIEFMEKENK